MPKLKNPKHELLAKNIIKHNFNLTEAHQATYPNSSYKASNANVQAIVKNSNVFQRVEEIANEKGLTIESLIDDLNSSRKATKPIILNKKIIDYPDYATRLETTKTGLKIHGILGADGVINQDNRSINVSMSADSINKLADVTAKLEALSKQISS